MARAKITGYVDVDEEQLDPDHASGITEEAYLEISEEFVGLEDLTIEAE